MKRCIKYTKRRLMNSNNSLKTITSVKTNLPVQAMMIATVVRVIYVVTKYS